MNLEDESPLSTTEIAQLTRDAQTAMEHEVMHDVADLFELYSVVTGLAGDVHAHASFEAGLGSICSLGLALGSNGATLAEAGRSMWTHSEKLLAQAVADGKLSAERFETMRLNWGPPAPAHTQDAVVTILEKVRARSEQPPTGYHAKIDAAIRATTPGPLTGSPDPYSDEFAETVRPVRVVALGMDPDPTGEALERVRAELGELVASEDTSDVLDEILTHALNMIDDAVQQRTSDVYSKWKTVRYYLDAYVVDQPWPPALSKCGAVTTSALKGTAWCNRDPHEHGKHQVIGHENGAVLHEWDNLNDTLAQGWTRAAHGAGRGRLTIRQTGFRVLNGEIIRTGVETFVSGIGCNPAAGLPAVLAQLPTRKG